MQRDGRLCNRAELGIMYDCLEYPCAHECFANEIQELRNGRLSTRSGKSTSRSSNISSL